MKTKIAVIAGTMVCLLTAAALDGPGVIMTTVLWDDYKDPLAVSLKLRVGTNGPGVYSTNFTIATTNTVFVFTGKLGVQYWADLIAVGASGMESLPSNVINWTNPASLMPPSNLRTGLIIYVPESDKVKPTEAP